MVYLFLTPLGRGPPWGEELGGYEGGTGLMPMRVATRRRAAGGVATLLPPARLIDPERDVYVV